MKRKRNVTSQYVFSQDKKKKRIVCKEETGEAWADTERHVTILGFSDLLPTWQLHLNLNIWKSHRSIFATFIFQADASCETCLPTNHTLEPTLIGRKKMKCLFDQLHRGHQIKEKVSPIFKGRMHMASCFSISPLDPNLWNVHFVIRGKMYTWQGKVFLNIFIQTPKNIFSLRLTYISDCYSEFWY